jgi:heme exporter protein A
MSPEMQNTGRCGTAGMDAKKITVTPRSLSKRFGARQVFSGIELSCASSGSLAITGPNGSGKSTLLEVLAGLQRQSAGSVEWLADGAPLASRALLMNTGFMSPRTSPYGELTALENIDFALRGRATGERENGLLESFGLYKHRNVPVRHYSTGMRQRMKFILAVLDCPPVLMLDEPGANLDRDGRDRLYGFIEEIRPLTMIILATNDEEEAALCRGRLSLA